MVDRQGLDPCLDCPDGNKVEAGSRSVRCRACRRRHALAMDADKQFDKRVRDEADRNADRVRRGLDPYPPVVRAPRRREPPWDQQGREVVREPSRLSRGEVYLLRQALDRLDEATAAVRAALNPRR